MWISNVTMTMSYDVSSKNWPLRERINCLTFVGEMERCRFRVIYLIVDNCKNFVRETVKHPSICIIQFHVSPLDGDVDI